ncbi:MAG: Folylpolyglutamate synthase FolC [Thermoanaerobacterales bacterium 50_218]|nr:MAG: Folylpolyglutamate synthase FolC [Thermoanaerobacterales bacterium 50_218]
MGLFGEFLAQSVFWEGVLVNYQEALTFLANLTKFGINLGLGRMEYLLDLLGNPHKHLRVIHIGGTNGKGSTAMITAQVLEEAGYRVGLFTSPHLHSYTERYLINRNPISEERFAELMTRLRPLLEKMVAEGREHPTEFEVCTALAFLYFFEEKVDFLVLEVGMGGAIDSTNVVPSPLVSVITNVTLDHMDYLGNTITEIARVKAGIIKKGGYVVTAERKSQALEVIENKCREENAFLVRVGSEITWEIKEARPSGNSFSLSTPWSSYPDLYIPLAGQFQVVNAATAVGVLEVLKNFYGFGITSQHIKKGLEKVSWPARHEILGRNPLVLVDVAHNHDGAKALRRSLEEVYDYRSLILVLGMLGDKEREKVVRELAPLASTVIITRPNSPRAGDWEELAGEARAYAPRVKVIADIPEAVDAAFQEAGREDLICITGSFYMVADARAYLQEKYATPSFL